MRVRVRGCSGVVAFPLNCSTRVPTTLRTVIRMCGAGDLGGISWPLLIRLRQVTTGRHLMSAHVQVRP